MTAPPRRRAWLRGRAAEALAALWLQLRGYRILARRVRTPVGEVDLVAARGRIVAIVEVKQRASVAEAAESILPRQRRRLERAAQWLVARHPHWRERMLRFDAVLVVPWRLPRHVIDAWRPDATL